MLLMEVIGHHYRAASIVVLFARQSGRHFTFHDANARADRSLLATAFLQHQNITTLPSMPILLLHAQWRNSVFIWGWGQDLRRGGGGGGARRRHRNDFFPSHVLCTIKSQMGDPWGGGGSIVTPLFMRYATDFFTILPPIEFQIFPTIFRRKRGKKKL